MIFLCKYRGEILSRICSTNLAPLAILLFDIKSNAKYLDVGETL